MQLFKKCSKNLLSLLAIVVGITQKEVVNKIVKKMMLTLFMYAIGYLLHLQHLRVEENPILKMPHLEAACILLVGPTLKKFNDRGIFHLYLSCWFSWIGSVCVNIWWPSSTTSPYLFVSLFCICLFLYKFCTVICFVFFNHGFPCNKWGHS